MTDPLVTSEASARPPFGLWLLGLALLVPGLLLYFNVQLRPALDTFALSQTDANMMREPESVGMANFERLGQDESFARALGYSITLVTGRLLVVAFVPLIVGALAGGQRFGGRVASRLLLSIIAVLLSPVAIAVLLSIFLSPMWGRAPAAIDFGRPLNSLIGAAAAIRQIDMLITVGIAAVVGGSAFMAVLRGREISFSSARAGIGIWLLGLLLVLATLPQTFDLTFVLTGGGPGNATNTVALEIHRSGFQFLRLGYAAAMATYLLIYCAIIGLLAGLLVTLFGLRLRFTPPPKPFDAAPVAGAIGLPLLILFALPFLGLFVWGVWLAGSGGGFSEQGRMPNIPQTLINTITGPWQAIWLTQLPVTYLLALALGFIRPFGRIFSNILFVLLVALAFLPVEALMLNWFIAMRDLNLLNTLSATGYSWQVSAFSLIILKLFFDGAVERYQAARADGQPPSDAFINTVLLPSLAVTLVVGAALSFAATTHLIWPLIVISSPDQFGFPLALPILRAQMTADATAIAAYAVTFVGLVGIVFLIIFALLHIFVLDRLAIIAGPSAESQKPKRASQAANDALLPENAPDVGGSG